MSSVHTYLFNLASKISTPTIIEPAVKVGDNIRYATDGYAVTTDVLAVDVDNRSMTVAWPAGYGPPFHNQMVYNGKTTVRMEWATRPNGDALVRFMTPQEVAAEIMQYAQSLYSYD